MNSRFINSNKIMVFPSARRTSTIKNPSSRLTSEAMLINIVNHLTDYEGFIISDSIAANTPFEFNLHGYYFKIDDGKDLLDILSEGSRLYANIVIDKGNDYPELLSYDDANNEYKGLQLTIDTPLNPSEIGVNREVYSLLLLNKTSDNVYSIPTSSKLKFNTTSIIDDDIIDGGMIS